MSLVVFNEFKGPSRRGTRATKEVPQNTLLQVFKPEFVSTDNSFDVPEGLTARENVVYQMYKRCKRNPKWERDLEYYTDHFESLGADPEIIQMAENLVEATGDSSSVDLLQKLSCFIVINGFDVSAMSDATEGEALDLKYALVNHSCLPNTYCISLGDSFALMSNRGLQKNSEITTNYCYGAVPKFMRQLHLKTQFCFDCTCVLCKKSYDYFFSYNCPKCKRYMSNLNLKSLFDPTTEAYECSCSHVVSQEDLDKVKKYHRFLILNAVYEKLNPGNQDFEYYKIEGLLKTMDEPDAEAFVSKAFFGGISEIDDAKVGRIRRRIFWLLSSQIVPGYCFPLNFYISYLATQKAHAMAWDDQLRMVISDCLLVSIPQNISAYKNAMYPQTKVLATCLVILSGSSQHDPELLHSLYVCSHHLYAISDKRFREQASVCKRLRDAALGSLLKKSRQLLEEHQLEHESFAVHFQKVLDHAGVQLRCKKGRFFVQYANREFGELA